MGTEVYLPLVSPYDQVVRAYGDSDGLNSRPTEATERAHASERLELYVRLLKLALSSDQDLICPVQIGIAIAFQAGRIVGRSALYPEARMATPT